MSGTTNKEYQLDREDEPAVKFFGEEIASTWNSSERDGGNYSGDPFHWTVLNLYRTAGGQYVCERIERTRRLHEYDRHYAEVCENEAEVIEFFGFGRLAKDLYDEASISTAVEVT